MHISQSHRVEQKMLQAYKSLSKLTFSTVQNTNQTTLQHKPKIRITNQAEIPVVYHFGLGSNDEWQDCSSEITSRATIRN